MKDHNPLELSETSGHLLSPLPSAEEEMTLRVGNLPGVVHLARTRAGQMQPLQHNAASSQVWDPVLVISLGPQNVEGREILGGTDL